MQEYQINNNQTVNRCPKISTPSALPLVVYATYPLNWEQRKTWMIGSKPSETISRPQIISKLQSWKSWGGRNKKDNKLNATNIKFLCKIMQFKLNKTPQNQPRSNPIERRNGQFNLKANKFTQRPIIHRLRSNARFLNKEERPIHSNKTQIPPDTFPTKSQHNSNNESTRK